MSIIQALEKKRQEDRGRRTTISYREPRLHSDILPQKQTKAWGIVVQDFNPSRGRSISVSSTPA